MSTDWYAPFILYGASVRLQTATLKRLRALLASIDLQHPFEIHGLLPEFHSNMSDNHETQGIIVLGFRPVADLHKTCALADALQVFLKRPELAGVGFEDLRFHTGIPWEIYALLVRRVFRDVRRVFLPPLRRSINNAFASWLLARSSALTRVVH